MLCSAAATAGMHEPAARQYSVVPPVSGTAGCRRDKQAGQGEKCLQQSNKRGATVTSQGLSSGGDVGLI